MSNQEQSDPPESIPWPQRLFNSEWVLALAAVLFWVLAYVVWGLIDLISVPIG